MVAMCPVFHYREAKGLYNRMQLPKQEFVLDVAGKPFTLTVSSLANQANASAIGTYGDTAVLVTAVIGSQDRPTDFFPLTIDYEERFYAAGKILGSRFMRREGRPSDEAVLSGRLIDRAVRPLFNHDLRRDVQVVVTILSYDGENDPDFVAFLTVSSVLMMSDIPWNGPIGGIKMAKTKDGEFILNPINSRIEDKNKLVYEAFIGATEDRISMIELTGNEASEEEVAEGFAMAHEEIKKMCVFQKELQAKIGKKKMEGIFVETNADFVKRVQEFLVGKLEAGVYGTDKAELHQKMHGIKTDLIAHLKEAGYEDLAKLDAVLETEIDALMHKNILEENRRPDGRAMDQVRELYGEVGMFKRLHGTGLFMRGATQALAVTTLGAPGDEQLVETIETSGKKRFMLHYNFPPYSTGEVKRMGGVGRREIGHGALAKKAIEWMLPNQEEFPYVIRVVSEVLGSNGSSSMATTCATTLSLMDAGVPMKKMVGGIAMGLVMDHAGNYKVLTDIQGPEDHYGDMDCKVAGTSDGITAMQMDVKIEGITVQILKDTLAASKKARLHILETMKNVIAEPRKELSPYAPSIISMRIDPERIGAVIGSGGKVINGIIAETGVITINIEDDGVISIAAIGHEKAEAAKRIIEGILKEYEVGEVVNGKIIKLLDFGAVVDLGGGKDGMVHISEFKHGFVEKISDVAHLGDEVVAQVIRAEQGKLSLSVKALLPKPEGQPKRDELSRPGQHEGHAHGDRQRPRGLGGSRHPRNEEREPHRSNPAVDGRGYHPEHTERSVERVERTASGDVKGKSLEEVLQELESGQAYKEDK
ncbi:MAG: Polyribonucleotide nucleotidyltransferase [Candidatus Wolfebacteria bacterium GW2011_GWC1_47_103]|nr:MAG: Polyribonucleotide nucleotidyltransferase [Candidatus Wolfebacteria bacterium GW2011_GWC1_47_103]